MALHLGSLTPLQSLGVPVSLVGSVFLAIGAELQHAGVRASAKNSLQEGKKLASVARMMRTPVWLLGTSFLGLAIVFQLVSLALAPLTVVQPLGAVALVITALVNARVTHARLDRKAVRAIVLCVGGIGLFVGVAAATTSSPPVQDAQLIAVLVILAAVLAAVAVGFAVARYRLGTVGYVFGAGILFGFVATLAKVIIDRVHTVVVSGSGFTGTDWLTLACLVGLAAAGAFGLYLVQKAYALGPPDLVVAGLTVIDPMIGVTVGIAVLGEARNAPLWVIPIFAAAAAIAIFGVLQLARHPAKVALRPATAARTGTNASQQPARNGAQVAPRATDGI